MATASVTKPVAGDAGSGEQFSSLEFRELGFRYGTGTQALGRVSFTVKAGEFITVLGPSGCGKSTLFNLASGLARATSGEVLVNGETLAATNPHVAYMFQHDALLDWRTDATRRALLLLDEPFGALDALTRVRMQEFLLRRWENDDRTVLFITHDVDEALLLGDRVIVLSERPASVLAEIAIPTARPRDPEAMAGDPEIARLRSQIMHMLRTSGIPQDEKESIGDGARD
jgi:putative hydroxymethylpyrimidine transport system ATP-binding protein